MERQYIGARYVPLFYEGANGNNWDSGVQYEPLTIVTYLGNSYTSKKAVPATIGDPSTNPAYWVSTGNYNGQVEAYRQEVQEVIQKTENAVTPEQFGAVGDGIEDDTQAVVDAINSGKPVLGFGTYLVSASIRLPSYFAGYFYKIKYTGQSNCFWTYGHDINLIVQIAEGLGSGYGTFLYNRDPADDSTAGVSYANIYNIGIISGFDTGVKFESYTPHKGIQYCQLTFQRIWDCVTGIDLEAVSPDTWRAWTNNITVFGGQIGGGTNHPVNIGIKMNAPATSSPANEISDCKFYNVTFEGCTVNCIKMINAMACAFHGVRLAEVANTAPLWIDSEGGGAHVFEGYMNFNINLIRDAIASGSTASLAGAGRFKNRYNFFNAQFRTNTFAGNVNMYSYNGMFSADTGALARNQAFVNVGDADIDLNTYDLQNSFFMNGFTVIIYGNHEVTLPVIFGALFTEIVIYISQGGTNPVTVKDSTGATLATLTGNGKHLIKYTQDKAIAFKAE